MVSGNEGVDMKRMRCPRCSKQSMVLIRDGDIIKCNKCGDQFDPVYVEGYTDGYKDGRKQKVGL